MKRVRHSMKSRLKKIYKSDGQDRLLPRLSVFLFDRSRMVAVLWIALTIIGIFSYTTFLRREGFPSINIPYSIVQGTYFVDDPAKVDSDIAKPISEIALQDERVKTVRSMSQGSFYNVMIQYDESVEAGPAGKQIEQRIEEAGVLPSAATLTIETPRFGFTERGDDAVITVYSKDKSASLDDLVAEGDKLAQFISEQNLPDIDRVSLVSPFLSGSDAANGNATELQVRFDRYGERQDGTSEFYDSVAVGVMQRADSDVVALEEKLQDIVSRYNQEESGDNMQAVVTASYAHEIRGQISELQRVLLEALVAILIVGSIVIAVRASIITVLAMLTVLAISLAALFLMGQTLNVITLFALILCLALIVDDIIIMIEAIDAQRRRRTDPRETVKVATRKVARAMVAATLTAALSFAPLLFVGGILGSFIRAIPITVITALLVSLFVALIFIPFFARYMLLGKKQMGKAAGASERAAAAGHAIARFIARPMLWARNSKPRLFGVGGAAVLVGFAFVAAGMFVSQKVAFNIFPPTKDSNALIVELDFPSGASIEQAQQLADQADEVVANTLGDNLRYATYYANAGQQSAMLSVQITPYTQRDITAPQLVGELENELEKLEGLAGAEVRQQDVGPPPAEFSVQIQTEDREAGLRLANDIREFLLSVDLERPSGEVAKVESATVSDPGTYTRADGNLYVSATAAFDDSDTSTLVALAQNAVQEEFSPEVLASYGLPEDVLNFDIGQEQENQESFLSLLIAFPILLLAMYALLVVQFRSLLQPLLIFLAIPFSFLGISLALYLSNNVFSFFAMLGFFALVGLSIKNTILLVDYANQMRRKGASVVDAAVGALGERFRPLIATSLTAVVSLIPLALISPFWEGLAVLLIGGLLSSTLLVITVFPYYYLGGEYLRLRVSRKAGLLWLLLVVVGFYGVVALGLHPLLIPLVIIAITLAQIYIGRRLKKA